MVLATGYKGLGQLVETLFDKDVASRVGPVRGFGEGSQELRKGTHRAARLVVHRWRVFAIPGVLESPGAADQGGGARFDLRAACGMRVSRLPVCRTGAFRKNATHAIGLGSASAR